MIKSLSKEESQMKKFAFLIIAVLLTQLAIGCSNNDSNKTSESQKTTSAQSMELDKKAKTQIGIVTGDDVFVREGPSTEYKSITTLNKGSKVEIIEAVKAKKKNLYVLIPDEFKAKDLDTNSEIILHKGLALEYIKGQGTGAVCKIKVDGHDKLVYLPTGFGVGTSEVVEAITEDNWYNVKLQDGKIGWIYGRFIEFITTVDGAVVFDGLPPLNELLAKNTVYGIYPHEDFDQAGEKFVGMGWKKTAKIGGFNPGFIAPSNDDGYKAQILYSDKSSSVAYYVSAKNKQALAAYKDEVEKLLTDAHGEPRKIVVANTEIQEYDCGDKLMHIWLDHSSLAVGIIDKNGISNNNSYYMYLHPEVP